MENGHLANLPETWQFLGSMWWVLHVVSIFLVFMIGYLIGKNVANPEEDPGAAARKREEEKSSKNGDTNL